MPTGGGTGTGGAPGGGRQYSSLSPSEKAANDKFWRSRAARLGHEEGQTTNARLQALANENAKLSAADGFNRPTSFQGRLGKSISAGKG